ncbi:MAG TPA: ethylbenzene dehydrogenase-related protein [Pirellulales bacterium]|nr:ethylbenzene dehydrogenase-related protein [Pirellulales bacterium]
MTTTDRRATAKLLACVALSCHLVGCVPPKSKPRTVSQAPRKQQGAVPAKSAGKAKKPAAKVRQTAEARGVAIYQQHCAACHGEKGDGQGLAARFLFPKPRDFRAGRFRLVSTVNGAPTPEDLDGVLVRGMPGSAMLSWAHLKDEDRKLLVSHVLKLHRDGLRESFVAQAVADDDEPDAKEIDESIARLTTPGKRVAAPDAPPPDAESIARGAKLYLAKGCAACHGATGKGDGQQVMIDAEGLPTRPRDLTLGIFKGAPDFASVFRRIRGGMPGSPMPSSQGLAEQEVIDLVQYVLSLSDAPARDAAVLKRRQLTARRVDAATESPDDESWDRIQPVRLAMTPLWWRADHDAGLEVQSLHDGKTLAVRLSWNDPQDDERALRSETFKDAAAIEFYRGDAEPFVGMGAPGVPVDVWMWDADSSAPRADVEQVNPRIVVDVYPLTEGAVDTAEYDRPTTKTDAQAKLALAARAVGNQIVPPSEGGHGHAIVGGGPGTLTFRLPANQRVRAQGIWSDGRWRVVLSRALDSSASESGIALAPGERVSVAFALWNGSLRDRDGQKLITIWQDFALEP